MSGERSFSYYYGRECEQFTFYRIPKILISDPYFSRLSAEAKLLYGLMLDRMCLSQRNGWFDEMGRVFIIFPQKEIQRDLSVGKNTASRLAVALEDCGLIRRVHRGLGLPDLIYVMNFASGERPGEPGYNTDLSEELALSAGFDSPEEARKAFHGSPNTSVEQEDVRDKTSNTPASTESKIISVSSKPNQDNKGEKNEREDHALSNDRIGTPTVDMRVCMSQDDISNGRTDSKVIRLVPENAETEAQTSEYVLEADAENLKNESQPVTVTCGCHSICQANKDPEADQEDDVKKTSLLYSRDKRMDSRSLKSKPLPAGGLKDKPLSRVLESKPLDSLWITSRQRFKNQTSGIPKMGTENDTNRNINNISSSSIYATDGNSFQREDKENGYQDESSTIPTRTTGMKANSQRDYFGNYDYSEGLNYTELIEAVKDEIDYDALVCDFSESEVSIFPHLIAEMIYLCRNKTEIRVGQVTYNAEILKQRYLSLSILHIRHVLYTIQENHISPGNIRNYYIQMLYNAPVTIDAYYARRYDYERNKMAVG